MADLDRINSTNNDLNEDLINDNNDDSDNNAAQNGENDTTMTNVLHRNNFTAREHLFQAMFSRIALTYDRTFPPFARRFIEFMLLMTALSVLFILIYIHLAFVKAPITCLDHFSFEQLVDHGDTPLKHVVIRVEILSNPPLNYGLFNSYSKEYDDVNAANGVDNKSILSRSKNEFTQKETFFNIIQKKCHKENTASTATDFKDSVESGTKSENTKDKINVDQNQSQGTFYRLFHFPINPIIEKAEYWREKLSVRAMAPFRQTFNELELFAKSVFTEEKYIMEYSLEYGLLRLSPQTRERLNIPVHFVLLDATKDKCFGNSLSRFILQEFVGYDQIIIGSLKRLAERQSGKGYVRNVVSGEHYRFVNSWMSRTSYLAAGFIMIIFTLSVSMLLRYSHHQIFVFIVDLLRMLENNLQFSFPAAPLLTVVLALVGMEAIMSEFFNDTSTAFYTILIIWLADQYEAVCCRTYVSKRHWPRYFYLYHFAFYAYHYRFNGQFSGLALLCSWLFIQHSMFFFFHHYELPRLMQGIAVRAIMDSLIVERAENTSLASASANPNEDDESDMQRGDRRDNDEDPGSSNMHTSGTENGSLPRRGDFKPSSQHSHTQTPSNQSGENHNSTNNDNLQFSLYQDPRTMRKMNVNDNIIKKWSHYENIDTKYKGHSNKVTQLSNKCKIHSCLYQGLWSFSSSVLLKSLIHHRYSLVNCGCVRGYRINSLKIINSSLNTAKDKGHRGAKIIRHLFKALYNELSKVHSSEILIHVAKEPICSYEEELKDAILYFITKFKNMRTDYCYKSEMHEREKQSYVILEVMEVRLCGSLWLLKDFVINCARSDSFCNLLSQRFINNILNYSPLILATLVLFRAAYDRHKTIKQDSYLKINYCKGVHLFITTFITTLSVLSLRNMKTFLYELPRKKHLTTFIRKSNQIIKINGHISCFPESEKGNINREETVYSKPWLYNQCERYFIILKTLRQQCNDFIKLILLLHQRRDCVYPPPNVPTINAQGKYSDKQLQLNDHFIFPVNFDGTVPSFVSP